MTTWWIVSAIIMSFMSGVISSFILFFGIWAKLLQEECETNSGE